MVIVGRRSVATGYLVFNRAVQKYDKLWPNSYRKAGFKVFKQYSIEQFFFQKPFTGFVLVLIFNVQIYYQAYVSLIKLEFIPFSV